MASLSGTVTGASVYMNPDGSKRLAITIDVAVGASVVDVAGGDGSKPVGPTSPQTPTNLVGRAITVTTNGSNQVLTSTGIAIT